MSGCSTTNYPLEVIEILLAGPNAYLEELILKKNR